MEKSLKCFQGRRSTLKKKAGELAALCNAEVCMIFFGPDGDLQVWPENPTKAQSVIDKYREASKIGNKRKRKEKLDLSDLFERKAKKLEKQVLEVEETGKYFCHGNIGGLPLWDNDLYALSEKLLTGLSDCLEAKIQALRERIESLRGNQAMPSV